MADVPAPALSLSPSVSCIHALLTYLLHGKQPCTLFNGKKGLFVSQAKPSDKYHYLQFNHKPWPLSTLKMFWHQKTRGFYGSVTHVVGQETDTIVRRHQT